ncbi:MAG: purine-nucleoside phosphorylase [Mycoplasmataceae bacterium]|nr:purine-nucleoside phosphorylase [Mycoplasmataceae bacterium]
MTPHIAAKKNEIAKTVLMAGDPKRIQWIATNYLKKAKLVSDVRCACVYTGFYKGKRISIMAHGMGIPSIGIYSYELYKFYGVKNIIRAGTCGSYLENADVGSLMIADTAFSSSLFAKDVGVQTKNGVLSAAKKLVEKTKVIAKQMHLPIIVGKILSHDVFYTAAPWNVVKKSSPNLMGVEMEAFALYANAIKLGCNALTILTVSNSFISNNEMTAQERTTSLKNMIELSLNVAISL